MKVALLADIHGNAQALACVLASAKLLGASRLLIAGDFVGYYYDAGKSFDLLEPWDWTAIRGNHEDMLRDWHNGRDRAAILARYGSGIKAAYLDLTKDKFDLLTALPEKRELRIDQRTVLMCHGSPWDPLAYIYPDAPADVREKFAAGGQDLVLFGHSHYPIVWHQGTTTVVNPGSVGQPRDRIPGACWALWDTDTRTVSLHRESYDATPLIAECRRRDPSLHYLQDVLIRSAQSE